MRRFATLFLMCALICQAATAAEQAPVSAAVTPEVAIAAQSLDDALKAVGRKTGLQIVYVTEVVEGRFSKGAPAGLSPVKTLERVLEGTGLTFKFLTEHTVSIQPKRGARDGKAANEPAELWLAQSDAAGNPKTQKAATDKGSVEEMLVEGEREKPAPFSTANLDLTRTENDALPFMVFTARDIELSGSADLQEFLQNRLPQNFLSDVIDELDGEATNTNGRQGQVDLRGWGVGGTVFLLNGRRMPAHYQGGNTESANATPNLQGIPLGSIERIEILASAASVIYGENATGGVINIITRQDFRGGQLALNYETPSDANAPKRSVSLSYGLPLKWGVGLRLGANYSDSEPLRASERTGVSIERWRRLAMQRDPARLINQPTPGNPFRTTSQVSGATPNIRATSTSTTAAAADLFPGIPGLQNFTTVPAGSTGSTPLSGYQPGIYDLGLAEGAAGGALYAKDSTLGTANDSTVFSLGLDKSLNERWRLSLDMSHTESQSEGRVSSALRFTSTNALGNRPAIPANAIVNPFNQSVRVYLVDPNMDRPELRNRPRNVSWTTSLTLHGALGEWRGFVDASYSHNRNRHVWSSYVEPDGGWTAAFVSGAYNPFVDTRVRSPAAPQFYEHYIAQRSIYTSATGSYRSAIKASGPLFRLPAGAVQFTAGLDGSRTDRSRGTDGAEYQDGMTGAPRIPVGSSSSTVSQFGTNYGFIFSFDAYAGYAEATVPLLSAAQDVPLVHELELFGSGRMDHTVHRGFLGQSNADIQAGIPPRLGRYTHTSNLEAVGLRYEMLEGMTFRATQSIGFRPPYIYHIVPALNPPTSTYTNLTDPLRSDWDGELDPSMYINGGRPDLRPETTDSSNFGVILTPRWLRGLRFSVDYLESVRNDAISSLNPQEAINLESALPGVVQRGAPDASGVGLITLVDLRYINLRQISSRSVDFSVEQSLENIFGGRLVLSAAATRNISFKVQLNNTGAAEEQVRNVNGSFSQQIEWNGNAQLRWEGPQWSFGWSTRYFDYVLARPEDYLLQGGDRAPRALNHDLNVNYRVADRARGVGGAQRWLAGTSITFGMKNVFDREPRFWAQQTDRGIAPYDSIMGRSIWLQMRKNFE